MFKFFVLSLIVAALFVFPLKTAGENTPQDYGRNFVYAREGEIADETAITLTFEGSYAIGQNIAPQEALTETLAYMMTEKRPIEYDLVNIESEWAKNHKGIFWGNYDLQCVRFVEKLLGKELNADARDLKPTQLEPCEECAVLFKNHTAYSLKVESASVEIIEQNHFGIGIINTRSINFDEIRGFVK